MKNLLALVISSLTLSGFSFTTPSVVQTKNLTSVSASSPAQEMFGYLRVHRQGKAVSVNWGLVSLNGIIGFKIERSYDGEFFNVINLMPCNGSLKYNWKDEFVYPGYIYYRIGCVMNDNSVHYSGVDVVRIVQHG